mgnify:CR=1 FL=1
MSDITEQVQKQMEGTNLALSAVAEVLQKMDARLTKNEEDEETKREEEQNEMAKSDLVKSIAGEVLSVIKEELAGLDVSGDERKAAATGGTPANADDSESKVDPTHKIEEQQNTIQAARLKKQGNTMDETEDTLVDEDEDEEIANTYKGRGMAKDDDSDDEEEAMDIPVEEKGMDEDEEDDDEDANNILAMRKQLANMKKELKATKAGMQKAVKTEAESRLRKMGFREETGLQAPKLKHGLGLDATPIVKSGNADTADQLADLSYKELRLLQQKVESGDTDGVPQELLG